MRKAPIEGNEKDLYRPIILQDMKKFTLADGTTTK